MNILLLFFIFASFPLLASGPEIHAVRGTGVIEAVQSEAVQVPRIEGAGGNLTLAKLVANGSLVRAGDLLASFDSTNELKLLQEADAKYDDFKHQVEQKAAEHKSLAEKRNADLQQAEADLKKAEIELRKGPILSVIEQQKNTVKLDDAREHVASLRRSSRSHDLAEAAESRILELQRDRQKVGVDRQHSNLEKLSLRARIAGMVALENVWKNGSMGHAQEGDQLWPGSAILKLFNPTDMEVSLTVGEPDGAALVPGAKAIVRMDAFPDLRFTAHFDSASPVATAGADSSMKTFSARFRLDQRDLHLLPDMSVAVDIEAPK